MSDIAIFVVVANEDIRSTGLLPGDLRSLRALAPEGERIAHVEVVADAPLPERLLGLLHQAGARVTLLPAAPDSAAALVGGFMARLHEFICAFPQVGLIMLAGANTDRLFSAASFLQRAGFGVMLCGPDRARLESVRFAVDEIAVWSGRVPTRTDGPREARGEAPAAVDPYEVLVDEVTKGREAGQRVLLTSLKQRMRKRIRRFDETRLRDKDGRPMRKFKDFVVDAAARGLVQLIEKGNLSHVLLPGEPIPTADEDEEEIESSAVDAAEDDAPAEIPGDIAGVDPLLDAVDMIEDEEPPADIAPAEAPEAAEEPVVDEPVPTVSDFDVEELDEEAPPPPVFFMDVLESIVPREGLTLAELLDNLLKKQAAGELPLDNRGLRMALQNAFHNELIEAVGDETPTRYAVVDDWRGIIDFL